MTTTVATRRSVLSGLAVSALALAAMASFVLISVSGGAGAQERATGLDDIAVSACGESGEADCTDAELVLFSLYSNLTTADPDEDNGYQFYGDGAPDLEYSGIEALSTHGGELEASPDPGARDEDLSEATGRLYTTVVNESDAIGADMMALSDAERVQNAIVEGSDILGIAVYDPDAAIPQTVTVRHDTMGVSLRGLTEDFARDAGGNIFIPAGTRIGGDLILPIRGDVTFFGTPRDQANPNVNVFSDITSNVNPTIRNRGNPDNGTDAIIGYLSSQQFDDVEIRWTTVSGANFVVVEVDGNATSSAERLYLRLNETSRGSDLYVGEVQLFSAETERNREAYRLFVQSSTTSTQVAQSTHVTVDGDDGDVLVVGRAGEIVRAPFIADARDNITVRFRDKTGVTGDDDAPVTSNRSATVVVETDAPTITVTAPENEFATDNRQINFTGTATDADSGLDVSQLRLGIANPQSAGADPASVFDLELNINPDGHFGNFPDGFEDGTQEEARVLVGSEDDVHGLYRDGADFADGASVVDWRYTPDSDNRLAGAIMDDDDLDNDITFSLVAVDLAGNVGFSDSEEGNTGADEDNFRDDFDAFVVTLDGLPPALRDEDNLSFTGEIRYEDSDVVVYGTSQTGILWDASEEDLVVARNAIAVVFDDTVEPPSLSDFTIEWDGDFSAALQRVVASPSDVEADDLGAPTAANRDDVKDHIEDTVFLVFDQDIPSSQTPEINVSGVTDSAGNSIASNASVVAEDGLGPGVEVTLSGGSGAGSDEDGQGPGTLTDDEILVEIQVNEQGPNPTVSFYEANGDQLTVNRRSRPSGENRWQFLFQSRLGSPGIVCVVVSAQDSAQNATTAGVQGSADENCNDNSRAVFFTLDTSPPNFDTIPYVHPPVFDTRPIIQIPLDGAVDTSKEVTLWINDEEVETTDATLRTSDNRVFVYQPPVGSELTFDTHNVEIRATDFAGNESPRRSFEIRISQRSDFELALSSGWNLISFPSDPINPRVSAVFDNPNIRVVSTFDAADFRVGNQMATRNPVTGSYSGNLSEVSTGLAYWVFSEAFTNLEVRLQGPQAGTAGQIPAAITIPTVGGVNLVGVVDPSLQNTQGAARGDASRLMRGGNVVSVGDYLDNVSQSRVQRYDSTSGTFIDVSDSDPARVGMGLVVYINPDITGRTPDIIP